MALGAAGYEVHRKKVLRSNGRQVLFKNTNLTQGLKKIHYGCGTHLMADWLNVDLHANKADGFATVEFDLATRHPFPDNWFNFGFCEDFLEHLTQVDSIKFLSEVYRTLAPGGVVRFSFPGLEGVLKIFYTQINFEAILKSSHEAYDRWAHHHLYARDELSLVCRHLGFTEINFVEYGKSKYKELRNLDTRILQTGFNTYVELTK